MLAGSSDLCAATIKCTDCGHNRTARSAAAHEIIASRYDVDNFIQQAKDTPEALLSRMTGGVHLHTLHCPDAGSFERIKKELEEKGILYRKE